MESQKNSSKKQEKGSQDHKDEWKKKSSQHGKQTQNKEKLDEKKGSYKERGEKQNKKIHENDSASGKKVESNKTIGGQQSGKFRESNNVKQICDFFMKTGTCKFGDKCKFEHNSLRISPQERSKNSNQRKSPTNNNNNQTNSKEGNNTKHLVPPEVMELLKSCKNKLGGESLVTITDDNNSTWRRTCSILNTSPESILMTYVPGFLKMYQRLPENSHTALPPSDILGIMAKYLRFLEPPTDLGMVLVQEMVSERLSREQSMQMIRDKNQIKSRLMDLLKEAERANQRAEYELERACDVLRKVILIYKQAVETRPDVVDESEDLSKFWSRWVSRPTISWLLDLPFRDARDFEDSYQTLDYYIQSMRETWTMLTYYWGAAAFSPRCKCKQQDKICGDPLIHRYKGKQPFPRCSQRIRRGDRDEVCNGVAMWGCFRKDHEMYCKDCLQMKQTKICSAKEGRDSSTDIYNANIRNSSIVGESLLLLCDNLLSRHPPSPDHPIKWKTTYRLQPAQLVAIIPLISRNDGLERDHRIFWGEVVTLPNSKVMESNLRKDGKINIRLLGKQDCDLFEDFGLVVGDAQFRSGASIAIVDLRVFVPEVMSVLATMNTKNFEIGLAQASFKPLLLNSVTARMDNIPPNLPLRNMIQYGLQNSTISTVRQLSQEKLEELANELWKIEQIRSLDATQGKSFAMALMHSLHTCQGPPGSGKSYVGVCIVLALSQIRQFAKRELNSNLGPIVVLAYKNHALDEFLLDVLDADASLDKSKGKGRLIRLGKPDEEALLEYTETKNREEFEAQKELEKRLELVKQVKTFMKEISVSMMADFVQAKLYLRCLQMVEIINECENPSSIDAYNLLQKVCSDDLWVENTEEYAVELLETTEHILVRGIRRSIRTLSPNECLIKFNDIWKRWVKGEKLPPRCMGRCLVNEGNNNNNNKKKKQHQEQEEEKIDVQQCFNCASTFSVYCQEIHRCQFDQNLSSACIAARLDGNKALYCGLHTCSAYLKDKCSARKISEDISYCNVHSCPLCFEFKESTDLACISHQCQFPGCCGSFLVKSDLEYFSFCSNHCCKLCFQDNTMDDNSCKRPNSLFCDQHVCSLYPNCTESKFPGQDFCRNHLCRYCMGKVCNDSLFCQSHKCIEENCVSAKVRLLNVHGSKIPLDFCQLHACAVCATERVKGIGTNKICMATSSRQTCDNHFLCSGFLPNGNECSCVVTAEQSLCPEHSLGANTCGGVTNKKTKCKSRAIPGTGFCKDHQNQNKTQVIRGEQHLCFESNRLFEVIPMPNIVEPPYQHATSNRLVKYRHAKCTVEKLSPKGQPNWYCVLHGKVEEALNKTSVSDPSTELNVQPTTSRFVSSGITASNVSERSNIKNETNYELASSDDEDAKEVVNDARYIQGTANPDEMEVFEEEGYDDDDEAAGTQHNREIYQAEEDELDAFVMTEEADDIHEIFEANEFVVSSFNEEAANYYFALLKKLTTFDWTISAEERQRLVNDFFSFSIQFLRLLLRYADGYIEDARRLRAEASGRVLKRATVIGGTIVGAAKRLAALRAAEPFAVIVEEACEVLEPTLISVLSVPSLKKLELIGDHRQLPAFVNQYWYNVEMTRPKIKKSLFERIVLGVEGQQGEDHPVCTILNVQRRMRTSISALTKPEYEDVVQLIDHSCTAVQKIGDRYEKEDVDFKHIRNLWQDGGRAVPGMQSNIFFWDLQENKESKATVGLSACNENEAMAVTQLVSYFHHVCKVPLECITIITPYQGQKRVLVEKLRDVSLLPRPLHHKESDNKAKGGVRHQQPPKPALTISTVDRYQGDENDIVILSLVRVKPGNRFVSLLNRFIVASSRARLGFYIVGSKSAVSELVPNTNTLKGPKHWLKLLEHLSHSDPSKLPSTTSASPESSISSTMKVHIASVGHEDLDGYLKSRIGPALPVCCPQHRCQSRLDVPSIASQRVFPNESNWTTFCNEKCTSQLRCGHLCNKGCHIFNPWEHERQCQEVVYSTCPSHKIPMACLDIIRFQTNHMKRVEDIFTHPDSKWKCCHEVKVSQPHCGHKLVLPCHEYMACENGSQALPKCEVIVEDFRLSCGHVIKGPPCWAYHEYLRGSLPKCNEMVTVRKDCNLHVVQVACHAVDEENRKICKQMIFNFSRPRCHHEISMTCMDARTLSHLWKSHNYIACQQVTSSIDGKGQQSELMESLTYGPSELCLMPSQVKQKCRKNVSIKRSCKHLLVQECDQGFQHVNDKTMPKCEQMVTISCPMCAQMTFSVPCHQSKLYEEISTKGFQMLQASQGSLENYLDILKTDILQYEDTGTGRMFLSVLLSSECKHVLDFHQNSCEHPQSFRCSELLGIVVNKESIPPCQGDIQRALPCGHQVQAKCYERTASYPKCTQPSPPFQFPTCTHSITVKTCAKLMHLQQRLDEGSLHCQSLVTLKLSRCGHEVDVACGKMNHARKLIRDGPSLVNNKVVESIAYCVPCVDAPKCTAVVEFERDCGHCEAKVMCQEAFTWAKDAIPKSHPSLCRQDCQVQHPLCGHEKHIPCWMSKSFVSWNPWKESRRKDWMRWVELPLQLNSSPSAEASPLVQHFIYPPNVLTCEQGIVAMSTYPHINAANEELCTEEKRMFQTCNEVIQVVFESCGHSTALSCGEFCMASFGPRLGLVTSGLVCKERVELQCHAGHSQWLSCHESTQAMDNIDKMCNFSVDKLCTQCQINVVKSKCSEQKIFCEREVQTTLKCGHKVSWKCSSQHKQNDPRPSFQPQHQIYSNCMECVQDLWDREKDIEIDLPTMRDYCLKGIKKVVGNDQPLHEVFPEDPIPIEIDHIFTTMYEQARIDIISTFQNAMLQTNNKEYEFPIAWDCEEEVRNQKYVSNNYDLVFLKCDLGKQPDPKLIHQRRFDAKDTICGRSLEVQRLTKDALLELATGGEVKIAVALAFRVQGQQLPNGFITQIDLEKPGMIVHANKHRIKLEKEGYDHIEITTTTESSSMMYFWQPKAVVPLFIVRLKLHANCSTCFEDFANDRKYGAICGTNHFMCWDCFGNYIEASKAADAINGYVDSQGKLVCPDPECKKHQKTFDINLIRSSSPKSVFDELLNLQIEFEKTKAVKEAVKEEQKKQNMEIERIRAMDEEERKLYYLRNKIIEDILTPRCPRCKMAYFEFTGCFALTCANKSCNAGFCAWCEQDCGEDAHSHVVHCTFGTTKNVFGDLKQLEIVRNRRRKEAIEKLLNQENIDTKKKVLGRMKKEFDDLGLQIK